MSAAELRQAAETLRAFQVRLPVSPWMKADPEISDCECCPRGDLFDAAGDVVIRPWSVSPGLVDYLATMHPGVALALADLLDVLNDGGLLDGDPEREMADRLARLINRGEHRGRGEQ